MYGNDRVRFCGQCNLNVYNLSAMTREEAEMLIRRTEDHLCVRFYKRKDGTVLTQNCPLGLRRIKKRLVSISAAVITSVLTFLANVGVILYKADIWSPALIRELEQITFRLHPQVAVMGAMVGPESYPEPYIVERSEDFIRSKAIFKVTPIHHSASSMRIKGDVVVRIKISVLGEVIEANCIKGNSLLAALAEDAATRWQFTPTYIDGERVLVESQLTFHFSR